MSRHKKDEAPRLLAINNRRKFISQKTKNLFDKTQKISEVRNITESEIAAEIDLYRAGQ